MLRTILISQVETDIQLYFGDMVFGHWGIVTVSMVLTCSTNRTSRMLACMGTAFRATLRWLAILRATL
ncbi:MAG: hypothetical protein HQL77_03585 [Magnetococcales bacterium]|nr:hypothetical protein [Magnetococcales bacterium]